MANGTMRLPKELLRSLRSDAEDPSAQCLLQARTYCTKKPRRLFGFTFSDLECLRAVNVAMVL